MKTQCLDVEQQVILTKDTIEVTIDAVVYFRVVNAKKSIYSVQNLKMAVSQLTIATLRSICG